MDISQASLPSEAITDPAENTKASKPTLVELIRRWGTPASISLFDDCSHFFSKPEIEGIVGYRHEGNYAIVFGDPLCSPDHIPELTYAFHQFCKDNKLSVAYITASESFAMWAIKNVCRSLMEIGEELVVNPNSNPKSGSKGRALRNKLNNALRANITIEEYLGGDSSLEKQLEEVGSSWLKARNGPQIYLAHVHLFSERIGKRWFYAKQEERVVGVLMLQQLEGQKRWLIQYLLTTPEAPLGTSELLIISALNKLKIEGSHSLSLGVVQRETLGEIIGLSSSSIWICRLLFKMACRLFRLDRRRRFWRKFRPQSEHSYLLFSQPKIGLKEVQNVMRALNVSF
jgi:lysylphosphatidylglycerol synthetase-like protein (DUF2156 family)